MIFFIFFGRGAPHASLVLMSLVVVNLLLLLSLASVASGLGALPTGCFYSQPNINIKVGAAVVYSDSMTICSTDGTAFSFEAVYRNSPAANAPTFTVTYNGDAVCSTADNALIISIVPGTCHQSGISYPIFCNYAAGLYNGEFKYGVSNVLPGILIIDKWSGSLYPIVFSCLANNTCMMSVACNSTVNIASNLYVTGGAFNNVTNSNVYLTENNTAIFEGDEITILESEITLQQGDNVNETIINTSETIVNIDAPTTSVYNIYESPPNSCGGWADWRGYRAANMTVNTVSWSLVQFSTTSSLDSPAEWSLADANTLQYDGSSDGENAYQFIICLQESAIWNPSPVGQRLLVTLFNVTLSPTIIDSSTYATTVTLYNHTNPEFVGGACTTLTTDNIYQGNKFSVYALLQYTDLSAGSTAIAETGFAVTALPMGCEGVTNILNVTAIFNNTQLTEGTCIDITYAPDEVTISNPGVCGITVEDAPVSVSRPAPTDHSKEWWIQHMLHGDSKVQPEVRTTVTGTANLQDSTNIQPRYYGAGDIKFNLVCPIDCGSEPIRTNSTCNCRNGVETPNITTPDGEPLNVPDGIETPEVATPDGNPISLPDGFSSPTCECQTTETEEITTPDGDPLSVPDGIETPEITTPGGEPISLPDGIETPSVDSPDGTPVDFPSGGSFGTPTPIVITLNPNPNGGGSSGGGGGGPCGGSVTGLLDPKEPFTLRTRDGRKIMEKVIGGVVSSAISAGSSAVSAGTGAATGAVGALTELVTGVLGCNGGGLPTPSTGLGAPGLPGLPGLPGVPGSNLHASLAAAISALSSSSSSSTPPTATESAEAAVSAAVSSTGYLLPSAITPTEIVIWGGGMYLPLVNNSDVMPDCDGNYLRNMLYRSGDGVQDDEIVVCMNRSANGTTWYTIPIGPALLETVFSGNGSGLIAGGHLEMYQYPNGSLYEIRDADIVLPGNCSNCNVHFDSTGKAIGYSSGTSVITGNQTGMITDVSFCRLMKFSLGDCDSAGIGFGTDNGREQYHN